MARGGRWQPVARAWQRLAVLVLCALLLGAQLQLHLHALSHLGDGPAAAAPAPDAEHESGHEARACTLCLAGAAAANLLPAAIRLALQRAAAWWAAPVARTWPERQASAAMRHIRGPPLQPLPG